MNSSMGLQVPSGNSEVAAPDIVLTNCDSGGPVMAAARQLDIAGTARQLDTASGRHLDAAAARHLEAVTSRHMDAATARQLESTYLNVNVSAAVSSLLAESACSTPRTPEILNSLIAMSNPLDQYNNYNGSEKCATAGYKCGSGNDSNSSMSNGSPATSPASGTPPSIQKTCSDLIKAGLKLSIESKRKMSGSECSDAGVGCFKKLKKEENPSDEDYDSSHTQNSKSEGLTPEDEERRRRRRERNKIAATKCRLKKRERTVNLVTESEVLESQNLDLKSQLKDLEVQRRQLMEMLSLHTASCVKNTSAAPTTPYNLIRPYDSPSTYPTNYDASPYIRPESANILASSYTCLTGDPSVDNMSSLDAPYMSHQVIDIEYHRPESVLSIPVSSEITYATTDGYLPKATSMLVIDPNEAEYYEQDVNYHMNAHQQCHNYSGSVAEAQAKINNGMSSSCLV